ncbi:hypothetical protein LINPERHAP2_LOCUS42001 [Linum perenne]
MVVSSFLHYICLWLSLEFNKIYREMKKGSLGPERKLSCKNDHECRSYTSSTASWSSVEHVRKEATSSATW